MYNLAELFQTLELWMQIRANLSYLSCLLRQRYLTLFESFICGWS